LKKCKSSIFYGIFGAKYVCFIYSQISKRQNAKVNSQIGTCENAYLVIFSLEQKLVMCQNTYISK